MRRKSMFDFFSENLFFLDQKFFLNQKNSQSNNYLLREPKNWKQRQCWWWNVKIFFQFFFKVSLTLSLSLIRSPLFHFTKNLKISRQTYSSFGALIFFLSFFCTCAILVHLIQYRSDHGRKSLRITKKIECERKRSRYSNG